MSVYLCTGHIVNEEIESLIVQKTYVYRSNHFNSLPNKNIVDQSKIRAFADIIIEGKKEMKFDLGRVENIVEKGKMLVIGIFSLTHKVFKILLP